MRQALGETAGVYENEGGAVLSGQCGDAVVNFVPHFVGRNWAKLAGGNFDAQIQLATMADLYDDRIGACCSAEEILRQVRMGFCVAERPIRVRGLPAK